MEGQEGRKLAVFYDDGEKISRKDGVCTKEDDVFFILDRKILIPKHRVIRVEVISYE